MLLPSGSNDSGSIGASRGSQSPLPDPFPLGQQESRTEVGPLQALAEQLSETPHLPSQGSPLVFMINGQTTHTPSWQWKLCSAACDLSSSSDTLWQVAQEWEKGQEQQESFSLRWGSVLQHIHSFMRWGDASCLSLLTHWLHCHRASPLQNNCSLQLMPPAGTRDFSLSWFVFWNKSLEQTMLSLEPFILVYQLHLHQSESQFKITNTHRVEL